MVVRLQVNEPRTERRRFDPRFHDGDSAGIQMPGEVDECLLDVCLRPQMSDGAEQAAHDIESLLKPEGAHVSEKQPDTGQAPSSEPKHLSTAVDPHHVMPSPEELEVPTGSAGDVQPRGFPAWSKAPRDAF